MNENLLKIMKNKNILQGFDKTFDRNKWVCIAGSHWVVNASPTGLWIRLKDMKLEGKNFQAIVIQHTCENGCYVHSEGTNEVSFVQPT